MVAAALVHAVCWVVVSSPRQATGRSPAGPSQPATCRAGCSLTAEIAAKLKSAGAPVWQAAPEQSGLSFDSRRQKGSAPPAWNCSRYSVVWGVALFVRCWLGGCVGGGREEALALVH